MPTRRKTDFGRPTTTGDDEPPASEHRGQLYLLVIADDVYSTHTLPVAGSVVLGRSPECEIFIDHRSVSRRHVVLEVAGNQVAVHDAGSSNGTRIRGRRLGPNQRVPLGASELIEIGSVQIVVQKRVAQLRGKRVRSHDYFEARLAEECERCASLGTVCTVLYMRAASPESGPAIEQVLEANLRRFDTIGSYAAAQYEVLLTEGGATEHAGIAERIQQALAAEGVSVECSTARYPDDGRTADALIARAVHSTRSDDKTLVVPPPLAASAESPMQVLRGLVDRVARGTISVLILGETGVGKEVLARRIHQLSPRANKRFLGLNCAALSETLLESELFGHERGAFTGAVGTKPGLLEAAAGGTVFLDEVGDLPVTIQVKLLRVIEDRTVLRIGSLEPRAIDVRFVAATNRDLDLEVAAGRFRQDLYFRLNGICLTIPPLRERVAEIHELARLFIDQACRDGARSSIVLSPEALDAMQRYSWPGNIRELRNVVERAVLLCPDDTIELDQLPLEKMRTDVPEPPARQSPRRADRSLDFGREQRDAERQRIITALTDAGGNQSQAAKALGISRRTLLSKLDLHQLPRPRKRS